MMKKSKDERTNVEAKRENIETYFYYPFMGHDKGKNDGLFQRHFKEER